MKNALLYILPLFMLASCAQSVTFDLDGDKAKLKEMKIEDLSDDVSSYFSVSFVSTKTENSYSYSFTVDQPKATYHDARVMISTSDDYGVFFFGYDAKYTLTDKGVTDKENLIYQGFNIFFTSNADVEVMKCLFVSNEENVSFKAQLRSVNQ